MGSPPRVVEGSTAGGRCFPPPVRVGSPDDGVAILLDVLVLNDSASWQRNGRCVPISRQQNYLQKMHETKFEQYSPLQVG